QSTEPVRGVAAGRRDRALRPHDERAARDLEGVPALSCARARLRLSAEGLRAGALRVPRADSLRHAAAAPPVEARGRQTNAALGEAVGKLYVQRYFPPSEKAR